jgi:hypothetical protein
MSGFYSTGIFPFNPRAMDDKMGPSEFYSSVPAGAGNMSGDPIAVDLVAPTAVQLGSPSSRQDSQGEADLQQGRAAGLEGEPGSEEDCCDSKAEEDYLAELEAALGESDPQEKPSLPQQHYYVPGEAGGEEEDGWGEEIGFNEGSESIDSFDQFLVLPQQDLPVHVALPAGGEPQIDYSQSYILTSDEYVASLEAKAARKQAILEDSRLRKIAAEENKERRRMEKLEKEKRCQERAEERAVNKREKAYWKKMKHDGWGDKLHDFIRKSAQNPAMTLYSPKNLAVPNICRYNQRVAMLRAKFKKEGKDPRLVVPAVTMEPYMRVGQGSQPLNYSPWFSTSAGGSAGGHQNFEEVSVDMELGFMTP